MKKNIVAFLFVVSIIVLLLLFVTFIFSQANTKETFMLASQSPDGNYNLEAYRTEPGATVDFSIRVYIINNNKKSIIYDAYHEHDVKIVWIDNSTVSINDKILNLSCGETYDWRKQ